MKCVTVSLDVHLKAVAPCAGAWVEIWSAAWLAMLSSRSPPVRGRGLKFLALT